MSRAVNTQTESGVCKRPAKSAFLVCQKAHAVGIVGSYAFGEHINFYRCPVAIIAHSPESIHAHPALSMVVVGIESHYAIDVKDAQMTCTTINLSKCVQTLSARPIPIHSVCILRKFSAAQHHFLKTEMDSSLVVNP